MKAQSCPEGQQMTDCTVVLLSAIQVVSCGQQKEDGKPAPHCCKPVLPPHAAACRGGRLDACAEAAAERARQRTGSQDRRRESKEEGIV